MKSTVLALLVAVLATSVWAHSPLETTNPVNKAVVQDVPSELVLEFKGKIRLTRVQLTHAETRSVDLDLEGFSGFISNYAIPLQSFGAGLYEIEWRGLGDDGHPMNGVFSFTVAD